MVDLHDSKGSRNTRYCAAASAVSAQNR